MSSMTIVCVILLYGRIVLSILKAISYTAILSLILIELQIRATHNNTLITKGLLHAVTPLYSILAATASLFFGYLYNISHNLAVPMICHAVYDIGALLWAHFSVTGLSNKEQNEILESGPGAPILDAGPLSKAN